MTWDIRQNPYNFVRFTERIVERDKNGNPLLPPNHSVFSGNTGYIECELVNETPLICGGRHTKEGEHTKVEFFRLHNTLAIPSTSLKGLIRIFIEALTGSCMSLIDDGVLSYRTFVSAGKLKCGKVIKLAHDNEPGEIQEMRKKRVLISKVEDYKYGDEVNIDGIQGLLKKNNKNIENKKKDRIFYNPTGNSYQFTKTEQDIYNRIVEAHKENWKRMKIPDEVTPTNFHKLKEGDLIYFQVEGNKAVKLCYIEVPRLAYNYSIRHYLEKDIGSNYCKDTDLCIACRLFGYVKGKHASAGRVTFSHALCTDSNMLLETIILKPLGSPHPTSVNLYLRDVNNHNIVRDYNGAKIKGYGNSFGPSKSETDINESLVRLRGRKFYWHHKKETEEILKQASFNEKTKLNSTVEILTSKNTFKFRVYFHNLTDFELGLLLYALKLEDNMRHKLGMAKSLGFGTVKIEIKSLYIDNMEKKYSSFNLDYQENKIAEIDEYITKFKAKVPNFDNLSAIQDLKKILDPTKAPPNLGYPEEPDGKNYKWYMNHKNTSLPLLSEY